MKGAGPRAAHSKTLPIAHSSELMAAIGGVASKGAAELTVAPDEREY